MLLNSYRILSEFLLSLGRQFYLLICSDKNNMPPLPTVTYLPIGGDEIARPQCGAV
jgi:hypothetical protein